MIWGLLSASMRLYSARRERFAESSRRFLFLTIGTGLVSAAIVAVFGWIILQDASAGAPRALEDVRDSLRQIESAFRDYELDFRRSDPYSSLMAATGADSGRQDEALKQEMQEILDSTDVGLDSLLVQLGARAKSLSEGDDQSHLYKTGVLQALDRLEKWQSEQRDLISKLRASQAQLEEAVPLFRESLGEEKVRVAEILRRLAIGVVVVTFFLALVRFFGQLYRSDYAQVLRADLDDIAVRSFYISYKATEGDEIQRTGVLNAFLKSFPMANSDNLSESETSKRLAKEELEIIKELINAASKRI